MMIDKNIKVMKSIQGTILFLLLSLLVSGTFGQAMAEPRQEVAQESDTVDLSANKGFDVFASDELLYMTLRFDVREFLRTKNNPEYLDATLTVKLNNTDSLVQQIRVKARGEMRRTYCAFPPIMLKFKGSGIDSGRIYGKGTLKLVTHCNATANFNGNVLKEYLVYKMYNLVTPYSFKTRLARITYIDINKPDKPLEAYAFLIENEEKMAERNHAVLIKSMNSTQKNMFPLEMTRVAVFNYMIGNTDWSVPLQHNIKIMKSLKIPSSKSIPVPFDFDYSGFVNAVYAMPHELLPIKDVSERYYQGICGQDQVVNKVVDEFAELKDEFMNTVSSFEYLSKNDKKYVEYYLGSFYRSSNYKTYLISDLNRTCKQF
jgi:hypothetical protein